MGNLWLMFVASLSLLACNLILKVSKFSSSDQPKICSCECTSEGMRFPDMASTMHYKGLTPNESSCTCEDFLAPKLHRYFLTSRNETCDVCECSVEFDGECEDGHPSFLSQFHTATLTTLSLTFGLTMTNALAFWCYYLGLRAKKRNGYQRIVDVEATQKPAPTLSDLEFKKRIDQLFNENKALKLKFKMLEKKVTSS